MIKKIKNFFGKGYNYDGVDELVEEFEELDVVDLMRAQLKGITLDFYNNTNTVENDLSENEKKELYADAEMIRTNKAFRRIVKHLINLQGNYTVKEALTIGDVAFGRATINGIKLLDEEIDRLSNIYREINKPEEKFDKFSVIAED